MINVLIVDDHEEVAEIIEMMLEELKFEVNVVTCKDAFEGYSKMNETPFQLIFTDYNMPRINGLEYIKSIRNSNGKSQEAIICLITGHQPNLNIEEHSYQDVYFVMKPFQKSKIGFYAKLARSKSS
jgi:two-component system chemotaxis response regulator CheY